MKKIIVVLQETSEHRMHKRKLQNEIVRTYNISYDDACRSMPSGRNEMLHDMGWARSSLAKAGLIRLPYETDKGVWELTSKGIEVKMTDDLAAHLYRTHPPYR